MYCFVYRCDVTITMHAGATTSPHIYRSWDTPELHFITFCGFSVSFPMFLACLSVPIDIGVLFTYLCSLFFASYSHKTINLSLSLSLSYLYINSLKTDTYLQYCEVDNLTSNIYIYIFRHCS